MRNLFRFLWSDPGVLLLMAIWAIIVILFLLGAFS